MTTPAVKVEQPRQKCPKCRTAIVASQLPRHIDSGGCRMQAEANAMRERGYVPAKFGWIVTLLKELDIAVEFAGRDTYDSKGRRSQDGVRRCMWAPRWAVEIAWRMRKNKRKSAGNDVRELLELAKTDQKAAMTILNCVAPREEKFWE